VCLRRRFRSLATRWSRPVAVGSVMVHPTTPLLQHILDEYGLVIHRRRRDLRVNWEKCRCSFPTATTSGTAGPPPPPPPPMYLTRGFPVEMRPNAGAGPGPTEPHKAVRKALTRGAADTARSHLRRAMLRLRAGRHARLRSITPSGLDRYPAALRRLVTQFRTRLMSVRLAASTRTRATAVPSRPPAAGAQTGRSDFARDPRPGAASFVVSAAWRQDAVVGPG